MMATVTPHRRDGHCCPAALRGAATPRQRSSGQQRQDRDGDGLVHRICQHRWPTARAAGGVSHSLQCRLLWPLRCWRPACVARAPAAVTCAPPFMLPHAELTTSAES